MTRLQAAHATLEHNRADQASAPALHSAEVYVCLQRTIQQRTLTLTLDLGRATSLWSCSSFRRYSSGRMAGHLE